MKKWTMPEIKELDLKETAQGGCEKTRPDKDYIEDGQLYTTYYS